MVSLQRTRVFVQPSHYQVDRIPGVSGRMRLTLWAT